MKFKIPLNGKKVVNSLRATKNTSIFITGSNSDLATHIAGRYVSFKITSFTFDEVCKLLNITDNRDIEDAFNDYIKWGGMPQRFMQNDDISRKTYFNDIYVSVLIYIRFNSFRYFFSYFKT